MDYWSIAVETANSRMSSICQVGLVGFKHGVPRVTHSWVVDPEDYFDPFYVSVHGITEEEVQGSPTFPTVCAEITNIVPPGDIVVTHTHYDRVAISRACDLCETEPFRVTWVDSARIARRAWEDVKSTGYGLVPLAEKLGIEFRHHAAAEDARACGQILAEAMTVSGNTVADWLKILSKRSDGHKERIRLDGSDDGVLSGEVLAFTGALNLSRSEAAHLANSHGAAVEPSVTKKTTIVVVGDQDLLRLAGKDKSAKHLKAEKLQSEGQALRIIQETDFFALLAC